MGCNCGRTVVNWQGMTNRFTEKEAVIMKCKHCQAELEDGNLVCPKCGEANTPADEAKENLLLVTPGKFAAAIAVCVVLMAALVALVIGGLNVSEKDAQASTPSVPDPMLNITEAVTEPATIPKDTGKEDATCKGTYTVSDEEAIAAADTVVATVGDKTLTNGQLQAYYWMYIRQELTNELGYYASSIGLDVTKPLDQQVCYFDSELTWQQFFLREALNSWYSYQAMALEGESTGFTLPEEVASYLDTLPDTLVQAAQAQGFDSVESLLNYYIGPAATQEDYLAYERLYYEGVAYFYDVSAKLDPTDKEIEAYFDAHAEEYAEAGISKKIKLVNVRHILVLPEGASIETLYEKTYSDEAWAASEQQAQSLLNSWAVGTATEETFADLANAKSADPGSNTNGGLYTGVNQGDMMEAFDAWCFDPARKVGDTGLVKTAAGWHVMYYSGESFDTTKWKTYAENDLITELQEQLEQNAMDKYPITVDYNAIKLAQIELA